MRHTFIKAAQILKSTLRLAALLINAVMYSSMIIVFSDFVNPEAYGETEVQKSNQTSEQESFLTEIMVSIAVSIGGGTLLGYWMPERTAKRKECREIEKIRRLLNVDFSRVDNIMIEYIHKIANDLPKWDDEITMFGKLLSLAEPYKELSSNYLRIPRFLYWDALVASGSLIKLEPEEIERIQSTRLYYSKQEEMLERVDMIIDEQLSTPVITSAIKPHIIKYLNDLLTIYSSVHKYFNEYLNDIKWIRLTPVSDNS